AVEPRGRRVALEERLENRFLLLGWNAASGIGHREMADYRRAIAARLHCHPHHHFSALGELDAVPHEVDEDLAQPGRIADKRVRNARRALIRESQSLLAGLQ